MSPSIPRALVRVSSAVLPALALAGAGLLLVPAGDSFGFSTLGTALNVNTEREWRVFNNLLDASANDNGTEDPNFPGWLGAELALWKAAAEWGSLPHGDGSGDPSQTTVGDGGGNFDFVFAGRATGAGNLNKVVAGVPTCDPGTFAYVVNGGNFWRMSICQSWVWSDGPGSLVGSQVDLQGIATHEFGHSLGLGHSGVSGATMVGSTADGFDERSIEADDIAGLQSIYNPADAAKCTITGVSVDTGAGTITITGANFGATNNQVWFTNIEATAPAAEGRVIVSGVSSTGGGTTIALAIPAGAADGDVHVKASGGAGLTLSNGYPVDLDSSPGGGPLAITSLTPSAVDALIPGTGQTVTIQGTGFTAGAVVALDLVPLPASSYTVLGPTTITLDMPQVAVLGLHTLSVQVGGQTAFDLVDVAAPSGLVLQCGSGDPLDVVSGSFDVSVSGTPGHLHFVLYSGSDLPSTFLPYAQLDIGNFFSDLFEMDRYVVGPSAVTTTTIPLPPISAVLYFQSMTLAFGLPVADSNVQSLQIVP